MTGPDADTTVLCALIILHTSIEFADPPALKVKADDRISRSLYAIRIAIGKRLDKAYAQRSPHYRSHWG